MYIVDLPTTRDVCLGTGIPDRKKCNAIRANILGPGEYIQVILTSAHPSTNPRLFCSFGKDVIPFTIAHDETPTQNRLNEPLFHTWLKYVIPYACKIHIIYIYHIHFIH